MLLTSWQSELACQLINNKKQKSRSKALYSLYISVCQMSILTKMQLLLSFINCSKKIRIKFDGFQILHKEVKCLNLTHLSSPMEEHAWY